jgi:glycosyltransferase involved in cell wall biosynthesis
MSVAVSVLMCAYNADTYLKDAIDSILEQTFQDFEFIIINDASSDTTKSIIASYTDQRIKCYTNEQNRGLTRSLNIGLEKCTGKYIARMDADDLSLPQRLQIQYQFLEKNLNVDIVGSSFYIDNKVYSLPEDDQMCKILLLEKPCFGHPTVMFRKSTIREKNITYNESLIYAQDYGLWIDAAIKGCVFANIKDALLIYRVHNQQISEQKKEKQKEFFQQSQLYYANFVFGEMIKRNKDIYFDFMYVLQKSSFQYFNFKKIVYALCRKHKTRKVLNHTVLKSFLFKRLDEVYCNSIRSKKSELSFFSFLAFFLDKRFSELLNSEERILFIKRYFVNVRNRFCNHNII